MKIYFSTFHQFSLVLKDLDYNLLIIIEFLINSRNFNVLEGMYRLLINIY